METQSCQKVKDKNWEKPKQEASNTAALPSSTIANSPPSASSSPAHEFSFTISLHQPPPTSTTQNKASSHPFAALDLSPADEIFFHGHLLPLHLLSHLPVSPPSSTNSLDSFTLPITDLFLNDPHNPKENKTVIDIVSPLESPDIGKCHNAHHNNILVNEDDDGTFITNDDENYIKNRVKSKSFSLFGLPKWRKGCEIRDHPDRDSEKKKQKFDVSDVLKRYMKMVWPLLGLKGGSRKSQFHHQSYSFSGSLRSRNDQEQLMRGRLKAQISAPASMRTSPTNSGRLVATGAMANCATDNSTMEELQAAIQAAITHCKNSISVEKKVD